MLLVPHRATRTPGSTCSPVATRSTVCSRCSTQRSRYYEEFRDGQWRTDPTSDLGRIGRQQDFLQQTANSTIDKLQSDPFLASELIEAGTAAVRMDPGLDPVAAAGTLRKAFSTGLNKYQLPVSGVTKDGNAVLVLDPAAEPILDYFRGVGPPPPIEP